MPTLRAILRNDFGMRFTHHCWGLKLLYYCRFRHNQDLTLKISGTISGMREPLGSDQAGRLPSSPESA